MSNYVALITREHGEGRVAVITDRVSGYATSHGENPVSFWRQMLEWTAQRFQKEQLHIALFEGSNFEAFKSLRKLHQIRVTKVSLQDIARNSLAEYDLLYVSGLPELVDDDVHDVINTYVESGGGVFVENPNRDGENINILTSIDDVYVDSTSRPLQTDALWTEDGIANYMYYPTAKVGFYSTIKSSDVSSDWTTLMSNFSSEDIADTPATDDPEITTDATVGSEFGISFIASMKKGVVLVEEEPDYMNNSSSSSFDSSSSSSSSSLFDPTAWSICNDIVANWKLDENLNSPVLWDESGNFSHMGTLYSGTSTINSSSLSAEAKVGRGISFDGSNDYAVTSNNTSLNFADGFDDAPFSVSCWVNPNVVGFNARFLLSKEDNWSLYIQQNKVIFELYSDVATRFVLSDDEVISNNTWNHIVVTYSGSDSGSTIYHNSGPLNTNTVDVGSYNGINNNDSPLYMATRQGLYYLDGTLDQILIVDKMLSDIEVQSIYNEGMGTDECEGIFYYVSSSSSSSSVSSESSSSSIDSSSSTSVSESSDSSSSSSSSSISSESSPSSGGESESSSSESDSSQSISSESSSSSIDSSSSSSNQDECDLLDYLVPVMTSNSAPSPYVASDGGGSATTAYRAFDRDDDTRAINLVDSLNIDMGTGKIVDSYKLDCNGGYVGGANVPISWVFEGSPNETNWYTLDTQTNVWGASSDKTFCITGLEDGDTYQYFRIRFTDSLWAEDSVKYGVKEWKLSGGDGVVVSPPAEPDPDLRECGNITRIITPAPYASEVFIAGGTVDYFPTCRAILRYNRTEGGNERDLIQIGYSNFVVNAFVPLTSGGATVPSVTVPILVNAQGISGFITMIGGYRPAHKATVVVTT